MTNRSSDRPAAGWLSGLVLGALAGLTSISFVLGVIGLPIIVTSLALIAWKGPRLLAGAGFLTGWGLLWTVAIVQSTVACLTFERGPGRWCEPADTGAWLVAGIVMFALGLAASAFAFARRAGRR